ncbi:hypothetical protein ACIQPR_25630 [Streptomyces sp. NPDC091280]|uniref:hypothetical protein n=1 Tax=Streptomyces sp. NPDC091280 TaxID=3365984 RepID=UPI00381851EF
MSTKVRQTHRPATRPRPAPTRPGRRLLPWRLLAASALALAALVTAVSLLTAARDTPRPAPAPALTATVATIDGQAVPVRELNLYLAQERAATFSHFQQKYGAADGPAFWTTSHNGQTPAAYLKKHALADVTEATVRLRLAQRYGLLADSSYAAFLAGWRSENARREKAVAAHQVIYGPVQYTEPNYFTYILGNIDFDLAEKLSRTGVIKTPDSALRAYYTAHKSEFQLGHHTSSTTRGTGVRTLTFAEARKQVAQAYVSDQYQAMLADLVRTAKVKVAASVLAAVPVDRA